MDDPNITMEEYIRLEEEKARRRGKVFNWETAKYGKIWYDEDIHDLRSIEAEFPAIAFNDEVSPEKTLSCESTVSSLNDEIDFRVSFDDSNDEDYTRHPFLRYEGLEYSDVDIAHFEERMRMKHRDDADVVEFTSQSWGRLFDTRGPLVRELILEFLITLRFGEVLLDLDAPGTIQFQLGEARRRLSWRQFILALGLHTGEEMGSFGFARDPVLRLCHRMTAHNIAERSQAPEKVTVTDLFYLRGLDVGSVNIPYLLARYMRRFAAGRKSGAHIFGGQFARFAEHFRLLTVKILGGLIVIAPELSIIDMAELVRLQICEQLDDTWARVAMGPERQPDATAGSQEAVEDVAAVDEGGQADPTPVQDLYYRQLLLGLCHRGWPDWRMMYTRFIRN
nr:hypothetical protein [Tanacetum cinerariifolium]